MLGTETRLIIFHPLHSFVCSSLENAVSHINVREAERWGWGLQRVGRDLGEHMEETRKVSRERGVHPLNLAVFGTKSHVFTPERAYI